MTATEAPPAPDDVDDPRTEPWVARAWPWIAYFVLTAIALRDVLARPTTRYVSNGGDGAAFAWQYAEIWRAVSQFRNPLRTDAIFYPVGVDMAFHTTTPLPALLAWPVAQLFGAPFALNVLQAGAFYFAATAAYALAYRVTGARGPAFFCGAVFAFAPWMFVHAGAHYNLVFIGLLPLLALCVLRAAERPSVGRGAAVGVVLGATFATDFYLFVFASTVLAVLVVARRRDFAGRWIRLGVSAGAAAIVVAAPLLVAVALALRNGDLQRLPGLGESDFFSADVFSWVLPPYWHPWWGGRRGRAFALNWGENLVYLGITVIVLAYLGVRHTPKSARRGWLALAVVGLVLASGPYLQIAEWSGSLFSYRGARFLVPLPYLLVQQVPVLNGVRVAARFSILVVLATGVLAALGLQWIARRGGAWRYAWLLAVAVVLVEFAGGSIPVREWRTSAAYEVVARDRSDRAVLEVPIFWSTSTRQVGGACCFGQLEAAAIHEHRIVSGATSRYPETRWRALLREPVYRQVLALSGVEGVDDRATFRVEDLRRLGIGWVVFHRDQPREQVEDYVRSIGLRKVADSDGVRVYEVPRD